MHKLPVMSSSSGKAISDAMKLGTPPAEWSDVKQKLQIGTRNLEETLRLCAGGKAVLLSLDDKYKDDPGTVEAVTGKAVEKILETGISFDRCYVNHLKATTGYQQKETPQTLTADEMNRLVREIANSKKTVDAVWSDIFKMFTFLPDDIKQLAPYLKTLKSDLADLVTQYVPLARLCLFACLLHASS